MTTAMTQGAYIGSIGDKMLMIAVLTYIASYETKYGTTYIYTFKDESENVIVWKTSSCLWINELDEHGDNILIHKGDKISFTATIKEHSEYKGVKQTIVQRLKDISMIEKKEGASVEEKAEKQRSLLEQGDVILTMSYSRYKKHYPDCETVCGSYNPDRRTVEVIVKAGRMKASGTRGKHYAGYEFKSSIGNKIACYRAVSFENALKRCKKEFPDDEWTINHIYFY